MKREKRRKKKKEKRKGKKKKKREEGNGVEDEDGVETCTDTVSNKENVKEVYSDPGS